MTASFWDNAIILILFAYGLAFYSLGLTLWVESGRASEMGFARSMRLMAVFGLLHGLHEWLDMLECGLVLYYCTSLPNVLLWFRVIILAVSFVALLAFGEHLLAHDRYNRSPSWLLTLGLLALFSMASIAVQVIHPQDEIGWSSAVGVLSRYILGIPGALLSGRALWEQRAIFRKRGMSNFARELAWAALALALYGGIGQIFPSSSIVFPSTIINNSLFLRVMGFPVQLLRAVMAAVIAVSMIRVLRALEVENHQRFEAAERDKIEAERLGHRELERLNIELQLANEETERLLTEVQRRDAVRGELLQRITAAQEAERKRVARELHDETGQTLTGLALGLRGISAMNDKDGMVSRLSELEVMATTAIGDLRRLINDLRPPQLDDVGLAAAFRFMVERVNHNHPDFQIHLEICGKSRSLQAEVETSLFRIAQEGLTNVIKHAQASNVWIRLDYDKGPLLTIQDDGIGFEPDEVMNQSAWGLLGMQERVTLINGKLTLDSSPGHGTTLLVQLQDS